MNYRWCCCLIAVILCAASCATAQPQPPAAGRPGDNPPAVAAPAQSGAPAPEAGPGPLTGGEQQSAPAAQLAVESRGAALQQEIIGASENEGPDSRQPALADGKGAATHPYIDQLLQEVLKEIYRPEMTEYERVKAVYDYFLDNVTEDYAFGFDLWRVHGGDPNTPIPYLENRALSVLRYKVGMCEDMAAAMMLLLGEMGLETQYIPGFVFTLQDEAMDHAWLMVKVDGQWYHLDPDMEEYMTRRDTVRYLYFLRGDETMHKTHRWGEYTLYTSWLTAGQKQEVSRNYMGSPCPQDYSPRPETRVRERKAVPDIQAMKQEAAAEIAAYEEKYGALAPIELDIEPPVFGFEGYGPVLH